MNAYAARELARTWVETIPPQMPGLVGAHLVGGITTMPDDAPFPVTKDIDIHLIFEEGSPALRHDEPTPNMLEVEFGGYPLEIGIRNRAEYASAEAVLGNPEIAHHLTLDILLYDPEGFLAAMQPMIREDYARREWVNARFAHERAGLAQAFAFREPARMYYGISGQLNMLGYGCTFSSAVLDVAMLQAPRIGGKFMVRLGATLDRLGRCDLFDEMLTFIGVRELDRSRAEGLLAAGAELFDVALDVRRTPHPFQHKLHPHMRSYFVESCREMFDAGFHREAVMWVLPYICSCTDVIQADGTPEQKTWARERQLAFEQTLGIVDDAAMDERYAMAARVHEKFFALAEEIAWENPAIQD